MVKTPGPRTPAPRSRGRPPREADPGARDRLLDAATQLFAEQGFAETSTREICTAAGLNPGAIHYHFGDKDGLYRAVLSRPIEQMHEQQEGFEQRELGLREALGLFLSSFLSPAVDEREMRLHLRELLNPSPVYAQTIVDTIGPKQKALAELLSRHVGRPPEDEGVLQLGYGLVAMAQDYCLSRAFMKLLTPGYLTDADALDRVRERLLDWAVALVELEKQRLPGKTRRKTLPK